jgi:hypothetical protein
VRQRAMIRGSLGVRCEAQADPAFHGIISRSATPVANGEPPPGAALRAGDPAVLRSVGPEDVPPGGGPTEALPGYPLGPAL